MAEEKDPRKEPQDMLKVTKSDKTVHFMPFSKATNAFLLHQNNNILKQHEQWKIKRLNISQEDMEKTPYLDETYVTAAEAAGKVGDLEREIARLKADKELLEKQNKAYASEGERIADLLAKKSEPSTNGANPQNIMSEPASTKTPYAAEPTVGSGETAEEATARAKAEADAAGGSQAGSDPAPAGNFTAEELIAKIKDAKSLEEVEALASKDERITVIAAAKKKIEQLKTA